MTIIISAVIFLIALTFAAFIMKNIKTKTHAAEGVKPGQTEAPVESREQTYTDILDSLLKLNILLRKDRTISIDIVSRIEAVMDDLMVTIPKMLERYPGETLTYELKKIGKDHLYKTVKEFMDLSEQSRNNQFEIFKKTIDSLHDVSKRSRDIVEKNETAEFKTMANFLSGKFS